MDDIGGWDAEEPTTTHIGDKETGAIREGVVELDHVYEALAHPRRRYVCYTLLEDPERTLRELATKVAAWEHDRPEEAIEAPERDPVSVSLQHAHVPKLTELDVVAFDEDDAVVRPGPNAEHVLAALHGVDAAVDANEAVQAGSEPDGEGT